MIKNGVQNSEGIGFLKALSAFHIMIIVASLPHKCHGKDIWHILKDLQCYHLRTSSDNLEILNCIWFQELRSDDNGKVCSTRSTFSGHLHHLNRTIFRQKIHQIAINGN